ncbi:MAG: beta-lactamase family protein [Saprospiraceae bacterium]|nr:beta-lactamase family protein [Saprospiraceae bacterium]
MSRIALWIITMACATFLQAQDGALEKLIHQYLSDNPMPGLAVTIGHKGDIIWSQGFGYSDLENRTPVEPAVSLFRIGSVSKPFTAAAMGLLYEQGKLDLDQTIQTYVPYFPEKEHAVTVRQVAGHLGGIRHYQGAENLNKESYKTVRHGISIFREDPLLHPPGSAYQYSSYGWNLLSGVVEGASQQDFLTYMQDSVFTSMALLHTHADEPEKLLPGRGQYYFKHGDGFRPAPYVDNSYKWAGGGFLSTSEDVARFAMQHLDGKFLSDATFKEWTTTQYTSDGKATNYGIGWRSAIDDQGDHWVGHSGGSVGGTTMMLCYPEYDLVVVTITNMSGGQVGGLARQIARMLIEER